MQLSKQVDDDEPAVLIPINEQWDLIEKAWKYIPIKYYQLNVNSGTPSYKRILYVNTNITNISYHVLSSMPSIVQIKNNSILLGKDEGMYVKFVVSPPTTGCLINVKLVFFDVRKAIPVEGIEMEITVKPKLQPQ